MEPALRQRLIGASVLVALAVLMIPMLLDTSTAPPTDPIEIPARPADLGDVPGFRLDDVPGTAADGLSSSRSEPAAQETPGELHPRAEPGTPASPKEGGAVEAGDRPESAATLHEPAKDQPAEGLRYGAGSPSGEGAAPSQERLGVTAFAIQLGSFSSEANAKTLESKLKKRGYRAFVEKIYLNSGSVFRVRVGPEIDEAKAKALLARLETEISLKGILVRYP